MSGDRLRGLDILEERDEGNRIGEQQMKRLI